MSRRFRFYEKKRGDRRTGSKQFGNVGEALFFGFFLLVGCLALWAMGVFLIVPEWRANRHFVETTCVVLHKAVGQAGEPESQRYRPEIEIEYNVDGQTFRPTIYDATGMYSVSRASAEEALARFEVGKEYPCWYDPIDPGRAVLVQGYSGWLYLSLLVPASFIAISTRRLIYIWLNWGTSAERRSMMSRRAGELEFFEESRGKALANVPSDTNWTNSPGTHLAYRLPIATTPGWTLFALLAACLVWNGIVATFVVMAVRTHLVGEPDWLLTAFVVPFVVIGMMLIGFLVRQGLITAGVGATRLEISNHPLYPGGEYEVLISQAGRFQLTSLNVFLVCQERATYRQGTDTRTDTCTVYRECLYTVENVALEDHKPFDGRCRLVLPANAMHSFNSDHNEIGWKLVVRGSAANRPDYERDFPVLVHPPAVESPPE
ncbi:MAG TPA: DUF3592 domain-containing protein [Pirellulales bacterium]|nr:DUF3592 domain-containing protein [Pirellulales bacterium]